MSQGRPLTLGGVRPGRAPSASACEPYRELIAEALASGRYAMAIWQDLVDRHGFPARYADVAGLHERAFRRLGGTVRVIVLDNLLRKAAR